MSKVIVPIILGNLSNIPSPSSVQPGFKIMYLRLNWVKLYDGMLERDLVLDRPLDNFTLKPGIVTSLDTVLSALEKLQNQILTGTGIINQDNTLPVIPTVRFDLAEDDTIPYTTLVNDWLLTQTITVTETEIPYFTFLVVYDNNLANPKNIKIVYLWGEGKDTVTGPPISSLRLMSVSQLALSDIVSGPNVITYDIGIVPVGTNFTTIINGGIPSYNFSDTSKTYLVRFTQGGQLYYYYFIGTPGLYGAADLQSVPADFIPLNEAPVIVNDATTLTKGIVKLAGDLSGTADLPTVPKLLLKEDISNKISVISGSSETEYPNEKAIVDYISSVIGGLHRDEFTWTSGPQEFILTFNTDTVFSVDVQGQGALSESQYDLIAPNIVKILDVLNPGDYVVILYGSAAAFSPYLSQNDIIQSIEDFKTSEITIPSTREVYDWVTLQIANLSSDPIVVTHAEIITLISTNKLRPGYPYIISDCQTKYYIEGTNTSPTVVNKTVTGTNAGYAILNSDYAYDLLVGMTVTITGLPVGYTGSLTIGATTTVSVAASSYYFRFANAMQNDPQIVGVSLQYTYSKFVNIPANTTILDINSKIVAQPLGLINTQVHDGTAYMDMSAAENLTVPIEQLLVTAKTFNTLETIARSVNFIDDYVEYNVLDTIIYNDIGTNIGSRKGFIYRRYNNLLNIDLPCDWRVQRYRRWRIDDVSINKFINVNNLVTGRVGYDSKYLFTAKNANTTTPLKFYIARNLEGVMISTDVNAKVVDFNYTLFSNSAAKDFPVIPLTSSFLPVNINRCKILGYLSNTVIQNQIGEAGTYPISIDVKDASFINTTFVAQPTMVSNYKLIINNLIALDRIEISVSGFNIKDANILSYFNIKDAFGVNIERTIFGTVNSNITGDPNSTVSFITFDSISNARIFNSVYGTRQAVLHIINTQLNTVSLFSGTSQADGTHSRKTFKIVNCILSGTSIRFTLHTDRVILEDMQFPDTSGNSGGSGQYWYDITTSQSQKVIKRNLSNFKFYTIEPNTSDVVTVTIIATPL